MKEQLQNAAVSSDQAINTIYQMYDAERKPLEIQYAGRYGFINPGAKDIPNLLDKLDRKTRTKAEKKKGIPMADVVEKHYGNRNRALLDQITDWARFTIILPDYKSAPMAVAHFLGEFGGQIDCHDRPDYQAIHQHTVYKGVNLEFQFHTKEFAALKRATDIFYHIYYDAKEAPADEYQKLVECCQVVYQNNRDFKACLPEVDAVVDNYYHRTHAKTPSQDKVGQFCMYASKAAMVQDELAKRLPKFLNQLNQMEKTELVHEQ